MKNIQGLENITLGDLQEIFSANKLSVRDALPILREFRDKHGLTDRMALDASNLAKIIFDA